MGTHIIFIGVTTESLPARPLKFLLLTTFYPPYSFGGDAVFIQRLARALADEGHHVEVIHCLDAYYALHPAEPEHAPEPYPNVQVHSLRSGYGILSPLLSHQFATASLKRDRIRDIIRDSAPDVMHYHNVSLLGPEVLALGRGAEALKLYTAHEYWLVCPTHVLWKFNSRACEKPECIRCTLMAHRPPQLWRYADVLDRYAAEVDVFLAPSRFAGEMHARRGFSRAMTYLPSFVEVPAATRSERPHSRPYFLFVGRLEAVKGVRSLIETWRKVSDTDLLIAGDGADAVNLRALASDNPRVRFLGYTTQRELGPLYDHCIATIVPSLMYEVFTTVVLEAFAHKAPIIARDHGPLREMIEDSGGGLLYRSEEELLADVTRLTRDSMTRDELGANGFRMMTGKWSKAAHLESYFALIHEAARRKFGQIPWER
ncbi:MAG TPA: glycosyltransferase [Candidatus Binataceae bacterium]|nr:glycosyltransferase [Candidatus Binataceae bacterium]